MKYIVLLSGTVLSLTANAGLCEVTSEAQAVVALAL
jgi:hypothetical protein